MVKKRIFLFPVVFFISQHAQVEKHLHCRHRGSVGGQGGFQTPLNDLTGTETALNWPILVSMACYDYNMAAK